MTLSSSTYQIENNAGTDTIIDLIESSANAKGSIDTEEIKKDSNIDNMPMPIKDSNELVSMDYSGAQMTIRLMGSFQATNISPNYYLKAKADTLRGLITGNQNSTNLIKTGPYRYISEIAGTIYVKVTSLSITKSSGVPTQFKYILELIEANSTW